jgi:AraC family transcriptional regulator
MRGQNAGHKVNSTRVPNSSVPQRSIGLRRRAAEFSPCSFHGEVLRSTELEGIRLTEVVYRPNLQNAVHSHAHAYIGVTLDGNSTQVCRNQVRSSKPWTVMYHPVGEVHSDQFHDRGAREFNIELASARLQKLCEHSHFLQDSVQTHRGKAGWVAARLYGEFRLMDDLSWLAIEGLTIELIAEIARHDVKPFSAKALPWLGQVEDIIHCRYTERLTLGELARSVGVHPVHVAREFHRRVGCTIGQQIRQLRIEQACQLLAQGDSPLADIALSVGFPDQSQFTKTFRNLVGVTPSEYRRLKQPR